MIDNPSVNPSQPRPLGPGETSSAKPAQAPGSKTETRNAPAFKALLEKLQQQAQNLNRESETVAHPEELSDAVDHARSSLNDALSLSDRLLEAFREAMQNGGAESLDGVE